MSEEESGGEREGEGKGGELTREALLTHDASVIRRAIRQIEDGKGRDAADVFDALRKELLAKKKRQGTDR